MNKINYFYEDTTFILDHKEALAKWIIQSIEFENHTLNSINYVFCSDQYLRQINRKYLDHDYYTDIITFNHAESEQEIESDIFISIERVEENAVTNKAELHTELSRVMIHGVLHLVGYNDKIKEEEKVMREKENAYLSLLDF